MGAILAVIFIILCMMFMIWCVLKAASDAERLEEEYRIRKDKEKAKKKKGKK